MEVYGLLFYRGLPTAGEEIGGGAGGGVLLAKYLDGGGKVVE